jgi:uncharacterized protein DUF3606
MGNIRHIDFNDDMAVAYWCGAFCCSLSDLRSAAEQLGTDEAAPIGMLLAEPDRRSVPDTP